MLWAFSVTQAVANHRGHFKACVLQVSPWQCTCMLPRCQNGLGRNGRGPFTAAGQEHACMSMPCPVHMHVALMSWSKLTCMQPFTCLSSRAG